MRLLAAPVWWVDPGEGDAVAAQARALGARFVDLAADPLTKRGLYQAFGRATPDVARDVYGLEPGSIPTNHDGFNEYLRECVPVVIHWRSFDAFFVLAPTDARVTCTIVRDAWSAGPSAVLVLESSDRPDLGLQPAPPLLPLA